MNPLGAFLNDRTCDELADELVAVGCPREAAVRLFALVHARGAPTVLDPSTVRGVPRVTLQGLAGAPLVAGRLEIVSRRRSPVDGFVKYLFRLADGKVVESVLIPLPAGPDTTPEKYTLCISSQAGCALACAFCATGRLGFQRNLEAWEIVAQFLEVRADSARPITGAVFMGQGEPFHNYDAVLQAAYVLCDPAGGRVDQRRISISTAGVVPAIRRYTAEGHKFRLCVSLNAATPEKRAAVMPVERGYPLDELLDAVSEHAARRGRVTLEYVMLGGVNTGEEDAAALGQLLRGVPVRLNPIDVNDATERFRPPTEAEWNTFRDALGRALPGQPIVRRYSGGKEAHAACGMLAGKRAG